MRHTLHSHQPTFWLRYVLGVSHPLDAFFRNPPSSLVSCRCHPWASILRRFLPVRSPESLSTPGVLPAVGLGAHSSPVLRPNLRSLRWPSFEDFSIDRTRCRYPACLARGAARSFLGRYPLRGFFLLGLALRFRTAPLLGFSVFVVRTPRARSPWLPTLLANETSVRHHRRALQSVTDPRR